MTLHLAVAAVVACLHAAAGARTAYLLDYDWKFQWGPANMCPATVDQWPVDLDGQTCDGAIYNVYQTNSEEECKNACCKFSFCEVYQVR